MTEYLEILIIPVCVLFSLTIHIIICAVINMISVICFKTNLSELKLDVLTSKILSRINYFFIIWFLALALLIWNSMVNIPIYYLLSMSGYLLVSIYIGLFYLSYDNQNLISKIMLWLNIVCWTLILGTLFFAGL